MNTNNLNTNFPSLDGQTLTSEHIPQSLPIPILPQIPLSTLQPISQTTSEQPISQQNTSKLFTVLPIPILYKNLSACNHAIEHGFYKYPDGTEQPIDENKDVYNEKYHILYQLLLNNEYLSSENALFFSNYAIQKTRFFIETSIKNNHQLCLLHNVTDNTFIPVRKIQDRYCGNNINIYLESIGLNFDLEETHFILNNDVFNKITKFKFDIQLQDKFLNDFIPACIKEFEFLNEAKNNNKSNISEFTLTYNTQKPEYTSISNLINIPNRFKKISVHRTNDVQSICVLVNKYTLGTTPIFFHDAHILQQYPEYGFEILFICDINNHFLMLTINGLFLNAMHKDIDFLQKKIDLCEKILLENDNINEVIKSNEDECVKNLLKSNFNIDPKNLNLKIRAQDIFHFFENNIDKAKLLYPDFKADILFRNRLSKYLTDLHLTKKRQTDGFYYYGISFP